LNQLNERFCPIYVVLIIVAKPDDEVVGLRNVFAQFLPLNLSSSSFRQRQQEKVANGTVFPH